MLQSFSNAALFLAAICAFSLYRYFASSQKRWVVEAVLLALFYCAVVASYGGAFSGWQQSAVRLAFLPLSFVPAAGLLSVPLAVFFGGVYAPILAAICLLLIFRNKESAIVAPILLAYYASLYIDWGLFISADLNPQLIFALFACLFLAISALAAAFGNYLKGKLFSSAVRGPRGLS